MGFRTLGFQIVTAEKNLFPYRHIADDASGAEGEFFDERRGRNNLISFGRGWAADNVYHFGVRSGRLGVLHRFLDIGDGPD